ncbi:hypothetical protein Lesp02_00160 [Lentzea sp. NBRC 105346]|uniref:enoyl-CoA hydratase/isomerase family protein n=1 Tax=Lentzea sp. NBRC 105346 TaxID=3032205 RepID=UPI0024A261D6|nr:enoyl-CoA hydratase/isomerase family protein [Lentzea sp. NBRC 105346]GLZ27826.1 hypothetical protein Lesp02_00160 [Lentzea sp. NBRC 105346]
MRWDTDSRLRFVTDRADDIYAQVTAGERLVLADVAYRAAELFPGLVPTWDEIAEERRHDQADKAGREIEQGILFSGLFGSARSGGHLLDTMRQPTDRSIALLPEFRANGQLKLETVHLERRDGAAHVTIHNPQVLNAENDQLVEDLETAVDLALLDDEVRVGVLRGGVVSHPKYVGRRVFSAGINLTDLHHGRISFVDFLLRREAGFIHKIVRGLLSGAEKPWVGAVDSFAIGGGLQLLLVLDKVIAEEGAYFSLPAAHEGIVPGVANLRLTRLTGGRLARRIILGGRRVHTSDPDARLLCDEIVPAQLMDEAVDAAVADLSAPAVLANRRMLNLAEEPPELFRRYLAAFSFEQAKRMYSPDVLASVARKARR